MEDIEFILSIIQKSAPSWSKVAEDTCKITKLIGNSNNVYLIEASHAIVPKRFIYRIFGSGETLDISTNSIIFHRLSENKLAPKIYDETNEYRLEEYLEDTRNIHRLECLEHGIATKIASALKVFHSQDLSDILDTTTPVCISNAQKWRGLGISNLSKIFNSDRQIEINHALEALAEEYYDNYIDILPKESPLVLTHMDTSFLNFLYREEKGEILIIDYDYAGYCYKSFDIAMLLQDIKYDYNYPQYPFYQYSPESYPGDEILVDYVKSYGGGLEMFIECKRCMIATHYFWAIWAFTLYKENSNGMDMLGYGLSRFREFLEGYKHFKDINLDILKQAENYFYE